MLFEVLNISDILNIYSDRPLTTLNLQEPLMTKKMESRTITKKSMFSGKTHTLVITAPVEEWKLWEKGLELIQHALPSLTAAEREFLITGSTDEEFNTLFPENLAIRGEDIFEDDIPF